MTISDPELEAGLRDLRALADEIPPPPHDLVERTRERYRAQRRSRAALAAGGLVAALVVIGIPVAASTVAEAPRGEVATPSGRAFVQSPPPGLYDLPTRGSLAGDEQWLDGAAQLDWAPVDPNAQPPGVPAPNPPLDTRRVAFAGDVPGGRVALVLGRADRDVVHAWFTGPEGAAPDEMELATLPGTGAADGALGLLDAPGPVSPTSTLVLVAGPGDTVERALAPVVDSSGEIRKEFVPVDLEDGIGIQDVPTSPPGGFSVGVFRVRTAAGGDRSFHLEDSHRLRGGTASPPPLPVIEPADPRGLLGGTDRQASGWSVGMQLATYGLTAEQARPTLLAAGRLGTEVAGYGELYGMTHPSGATSSWVVTYTPGTTNGYAMSDDPPAPAGTALLDRVIVVQAMAGVLVSAPSGVEAQVLDASGTLLTTVPLQNGAGTGPYNGSRTGATVRILDGGGDVLAETPLLIR